MDNYIARLFELLSDEDNSVISPYSITIVPAAVPDKTKYPSDRTLSLILNII